MVHINENNQQTLDDLEFQYRSELNRLKDDYIELQSKETSWRNAARDKEHIETETTKTM